VPFAAEEWFRSTYNCLDTHTSFTLVEFDAAKVDHVISNVSNIV
jgi:hypothetical protein